MVASDSFAEFLRELLAPLGRITMRRMFGKTGVFCDGLMLGMVRDNIPYVRVDDGNREAFKEAVSSPLLNTNGRLPGRRCHDARLKPVLLEQKRHADTDSLSQRREGGIQTSANALRPIRRTALMDNRLIGKGSGPVAGKGHRIIVIGTSAGGLDALDNLFSQFGAGLSAAIFVVQHMAPENTGIALLHRLRRHKAFACKLASDGERFKMGTIYIAPPDYHLLVKQRTLLVTKGARENRYRPSVDPLFRSAAVSHGSGVIGVVLTGLLDDGTAGLLAVKKCGGVAIVQDPKDADHPAMPQSALDNVDVDHCVSIAGMGRLLDRLMHMPAGKRRAIPKDIRVEAEIAERVLSDVAQVNGLGSQVPYNCPNCGGVLWELDNPDIKRYRCHTGHSYTRSTLLASQSEKIEETLWVSLRMLEERKNLLTGMGGTATGARAQSAYAERVRETEIHIDRVRAMLLTRDKAEHD